MTQEDDLPIVYLETGKRKWDDDSGPTPGPYLIVEPGEDGIGNRFGTYDIVSLSRVPDVLRYEVLARVVETWPEHNACIPAETRANAELFRSAWELREALSGMLDAVLRTEYPIMQRRSMGLWGECEVCGGMNPKPDWKMGKVIEKPYPSRIGHHDTCPKGILIAKTIKLLKRGGTDGK